MIYDDNFGDQFISGTDDVMETRLGQQRLDDDADVQRAILDHYARIDRQRVDNPDELVEFEGKMVALGSLGAPERAVLELGDDNILRGGMPF